MSKTLDNYRNVYSGGINQPSPSQYNPLPTRYLFSPTNVQGVDPDSVIHHAPDAMILLNNASDIVYTKYDNSVSISNIISASNTLNIRNNLLNVSSTLGLRSNPGSASFALKADSDTSAYFNNGYSLVPLLSEVHIFIKGRFPISDTSTGTDYYNNSSEILNYVYPYYHVFWGVVSSMKYSKSPTGDRSYEFECKDILRFWELARITTKNSVVNARSTASNIDVNSSIFSKKSAFYIIDQLAKMSMGDAIPFTSLSTASELNQKQVDNADKNKINESYSDNIKSMTKYWETRFSAMTANSLRMYGYNGNELEFIDKKDGTVETPAKDANGKIIKGKVDKTDKINKVAVLKGTQNALDPLEIKDKPLTDYDLSEFPSPAQSILEKVVPYSENSFTVDLFQVENQSKLEIANQVAVQVQFEFYLDTTGDIIFKPPFYNLDVKAYPPYVIEDIDITNIDVVEEEGSIFTVMDVTGAFGYEMDGKQFISGRFTDWNLVSRFGYRSQNYHGGWIRSNESCLYFAQCYLGIKNAQAFLTGTLSSYIRPEIRLGFPVYVPSKDMYFYVSSIVHSLDFSSQSATTTLSLEAGRRRLRGSIASTTDEEGYTSEYINVDANGAPLKNLWLVTTSRKPLTPQSYDYAKINPKFIVDNNRAIFKYVNGSGSFKDLLTVDTGIDFIKNIMDINNPAVKERITKLEELKLQAQAVSSQTNFFPWLSPVTEEEYNKLMAQNELDQLDIINDLATRTISANKVFQNLYVYQITDVNGYEMVGSAPYGVQLKLDESGNLTDNKIASSDPKSLALQEKNENVKKLLQGGSPKNSNFAYTNVNPNMKVLANPSQSKSALSTKAKAQNLLYLKP